ncbi:hypothetical protein F4813DRAFT_393462 [Daldinia decipiens]|uniref:uncharacterized protein n=1 Tax=Daldinia decipiens TaxID=326647 RepID=UPI0020C4074A|nr:uncharacterized protein F4813DRAFT_393462 [Daldinia decipiens]KAI1653698.1 hypothetical protein F4813DRAFT_393462 [Daldinia decipiens]
MSSNDPREVATMTLESVDTSKPKLPFLPRELQRMVVKLVAEQHLPDAWCLLRLVCKDWKAEVERVFRQKYLDVTTIALYGWEGSFCTMAFDRLSEDGNTAFFRLSHRIQALRMLIHWTEAMAAPLEASIGDYFHIVSIAGVACSDPKLDGMEIDSMREVISIPWIPIISQVLGDEFCLRRRAAKIYDEGSQSTKSQKAVYWSGSRELRFAAGWNTDIARKGMLIYMINRLKSFAFEIESVRESRLQRQYTHGSDDTFRNLRTSRIFSIRNAFRSKLTT